MNYALALQLKEAGFPQIQAEGNKWWDDRMAVKQTLFQTSKYLTPSQAEGFIRIPTLSELIEACGKRFCSLNRTIEDNKWVAKRYDPSYVEKEGKFILLVEEAVTEEYSTPDEAVANLWLELNKKDNANNKTEENS